MLVFFSEEGGPLQEAADGVQNLSVEDTDTGSPSSDPAVPAESPTPAPTPTPDQWGPTPIPNPDHLGPAPIPNLYQWGSLPYPRSSPIRSGLLRSSWPIGLVPLKSQIY